jgi:ABC-type Mn2+/Zn2+ transport system ATPase subunit
MVVATIQISIETKDHLMDIGKKGDTFDDIIRRLLDIYDGKSEITKKKWKKEDWFKLAYIPEDLNKELRIIITIEEALYLRELLHNVDNRILKSLHNKVSHVLFQMGQVSDES